MPNKRLVQKTQRYHFPSVTVNCRGLTIYHLRWWQRARAHQHSINQLRYHPHYENHWEVESLSHSRPDFASNSDVTHYESW